MFYVNFLVVIFLFDFIYNNFYNLYDVNFVTYETTFTTFLDDFLIYEINDVFCFCLKMDDKIVLQFINFILVYHFFYNNS